MALRPPRRTPERRRPHIENAEAVGVATLVTGGPEAGHAPLALAAFEEFATTP